MSRTTSIVLLSIITALVLFLGVFTFIGTFEVGAYEEYYSPSYLIQKGNGLTSSVKATYTVEMGEDIKDFATVRKIIKQRLRVAYGYYGVGVEYDEQSGLATITIPTTNNPAKTSVSNVLSNVVANGKIEILNNSSTTYSESNVLLTSEHFKSVRNRVYTNSSYTWYLVEIKLTSEGAEIADAELSDRGYFAIDGEIEDMAEYSNGRLRLYAHTQQEAHLFASYVKSGTLQDVTLTENVIGEPEGNFGYVFLIILGVLFVASVIFLAVRYKALGLVASLAQLIAAVVFTIFAALVHLEMLNVFAAIGIVLVYAFMTVFTVLPLERIRAYRNNPQNKNKSFNKALEYGFKLDREKGVSVKDLPIINLIAHGALLVLGIILWVIPTLVTAPLGNVLVYGALLSFAVTFGLNRLFAYMLAPFHYAAAQKARSSQK